MDNHRISSSSFHTDTTTDTTIASVSDKQCYLIPEHKMLEPANRMLRTSQVLVSSRFPINFELLKSEQARLNTFHSIECAWPIEFISPSSCANAGFFFLKDGDKVQCAFCKGVAGEWEEGDVPAAEHKKHFPGCPFICNLPVGNIPIGQEEAVSVIQEEPLDNYGYDVCGPFETFVNGGNTFANSDQVHVRGALPLTGDTEDVAISLAIRIGAGPARKHLVTAESRLKTFNDWPKTTGQNSKTMANAGFFYIGIRDHVKCFYCDGGLRNWEACDDPWFEHARWFAHCPFVLLNKGQDYVKKIVESKTLPTSTTEPKHSHSSESEDESTSGNSIENESHTNTSRGSSESPTPPTSEAENSTSSDEDAELIISAAVKDSRKFVESQPSPFLSLETKADDATMIRVNLEEEVERRLKEARQCKICTDNEIGVVFLPCGHQLSCVGCATAFSNCALCRQPIKAHVRTYLP